MNTNFYDVSHLSASYSVFLDGATITKPIAHPRKRGDKLELFGLGSNIEQSSINVVSQTSIVTARFTVSGVVHGQVQEQLKRHRNYEDYLIRVELDYKERSLLDSGMINLALVYTTVSAFWIPRYSLNVRNDGDAALILQAGLHLPQSRAWDRISSVSNYSVKMLAIAQASDFKDASRKEYAPDRTPSRFVQHTWNLASGLASDRTLEAVHIPGTDVAIGPGAWVSRLEARVEQMGFRSLPARDMNITRHGILVKSDLMPGWNPGQVFSIELDRDSATTSVELPGCSSLDPCRIQSLLNPTSSEQCLVGEPEYVRGDQTFTSGYTSANNATLSAPMDEHPTSFTKRGLAPLANSCRQSSDEPGMSRKHVSHRENVTSWRTR